MTEIRLATEEDWPGIWDIFRRVVAYGDTYAYNPDTSEEEARQIWFETPRATYAAIKNDLIVGTYYLATNQPGLGSHVCNAGYMVLPRARGRGVGGAMGMHSLDEARRMGFLFMQYNLVVATNAEAMHLWRKMGFEVVGTLPGAFRHAERGLVDAHIMYRKL